MFAQDAKRGGNLKLEARTGDPDIRAGSQVSKFTAALESAGRVRVAGTLEINNHQKGE